MPGVTYPLDGEEAPGYLAVPDSGGGPATSVLQEWWGLEDHFKEVSDELYEGAGHAFLNDIDRLGTYDPGAAERSWDLTVEFLRSNLA